MDDDDDLDNDEIGAGQFGTDWLPTLSSTVKVDFGVASHPGFVRPKNEDMFLVSRIERSFTTVATNVPEGEFPYDQAELAYGMIVADGVGDTAAGEIASSEAIGTLVKLALETPDWHLCLNREGAHVVLARFDLRFRQLRESLINLTQANPKLIGMGTTLTVAISHGKRVIVAHVGDTRAYLFRDGELTQLTRDQTLAQDLLDQHLMEEEETKLHFSRSVLTGLIGTGRAEPQPELVRTKLNDGDQLLLCTDGLTQVVSDQTIAEVLSMYPVTSDACNALVELALATGGPDNVTAVLARYRIPDLGPVR